ncbi:MAG: hypothetical protein JOZ45_19270, partial [Acidobacteriaceae bacterium]|nr:hypothetical protein [Acidobacteriaceae bacterium]
SWKKKKVSAVGRREQDEIKPVSGIGRSGYETTKTRMLCGIGKGKDKNPKYRKKDLQTEVQEWEEEPPSYEETWTEIEDSEDEDTAIPEEFWEPVVVRKATPIPIQSRTFEELKQEIQKLETEMEKLQEEWKQKAEIEPEDPRDVSDSRHPQHGAITYWSCWDDYCHYHYDAKVNNSVWPKKGKPIYWDKATGGPDYSRTLTAPVHPKPERPKVALGWDAKKRQSLN